eukprot:Plantae.Rhodophyta-Purpureofilum_apyrenoidigerum.ctg31327.p1 GENE.Plantae.Rhodophyta-Purpureofilum_apyrenoidigerum.ctg31327~~Plantae.Rhodophyta-Purpureofilum_apyrenoidigerum.ctg31327.p1  ORF type:complete len:274 (-),score=45.93 Plantae.Rhodophyta-Purpureofilum_apyrenoidigerum.ctg31327:212-1033(-)
MIEFGVVSQKGSEHVLRDVGNQDRASTVLDKEVGVCLFAVYDGHGESGEKAAEIASTSVGMKFMQLHRNGEDAVSAVKSAFSEASKEIDEQSFSASSGTTAIVAVLQGEEVIIANAGDSSAVLYGCSDQGEPDFQVLSTMHRVSNPEEKRRIEESGGTTDGDYVGDPNDIMKGLGVTRTLGDTEMRSLGVLDVPEITSWKLTPKDEVLLLASDGLWDANGGLTPHQIGEHFYRYFQEGLSCEKMCKEIFRLCGPGGSYDDCTIVLARLKPRTK